MRALLWLLPMTVCAFAAASPVRADDPPRATPLDRTDAFERAYTASFYEFDACGDGLGGRIYRNALTSRVAQCPFSADAKRRFQQRATLMRRKASQALNAMIDENGGLPVKLDGMTRTCREQRDSPEYRTVRDKLDAFAAGKLASDTVIAAPCDAASITP